MFEVKNISKFYKIEGKQITILNSINFKIEENGLYFILGKSGCGKTTLLNILELLLSPDEGEIIFENKKLLSFSKKRKEKFLRDEVGIIFQNYNLIENIKVRDNLKIALKIKGKNYKSYLDKILKEFELEDLLDKEVNQLSGGEKQRLAIVRSILNKPGIIFCDEPTGALDEENSHKVMKLLLKLSSNCIVIVVTHAIEIVKKYGNRYFLLDEEGLHKKFLEDKIKVIGYKDCKKTIKEKTTTDFSLSFFLAKLHLKNNKTKNCIVFLSFVITFFIFIFSLSFYQGTNNSFINIEKGYINFNIYKASKIFSIGEGLDHLEVSKKEKPKEEEINIFLKSFKNYEILPNLDYFFLNPKKIQFKEQEIEGVSFLPYIPLNDDNDFYCNNKFMEVINNNFSLDNIYEVNFNRKYNYYNHINSSYIDDVFNLNITISIKNVLNEFSYLSTPTIYYPFGTFFNHLIANKPKKINSLTSSNFNWYDIIKNAKNNDEIASFSSLVVFNEQEINSINSIIDNYDSKKDLIKIENDKHTLISSFKTLSKSLFIGLEMFLLILLVSTVFLMGFTSYSNYVHFKREIAILRVLGLNEKSIIFSFVYEIAFLCLLSFGMTILLYLTSLKPINLYLYNLFAYLPIVNFSFSITISILLSFLFLMGFLTFLILKLSGKIDIVKELKEE